MKAKFIKIFNTFGVKNQLKKFNEETYELIEAINDYETCNDPLLKKDNREHVLEEICDCLVLINQFIEFYGFDEHIIDKIVDFKVNRTISRIETNYYDKKRK